MTEPLSLETVLSEFKEDAAAWVLRDLKSGKYVTIPHSKYPGMSIIHLFLNPSQAQQVLEKLWQESPVLKDKELEVEEVKLLQACRNIAADKVFQNGGFVVHPYNEVWEYFNQLD